MARRGFASARSPERRGGGHRSQLLDGVAKNEQAAALALIQTMFRQALDLLENPERVPGWSHQDPDILQAQGQGRV
jgi:hypothetical protein